MLKLLLKKQITEVFRSVFYDAKKNRMRPKGAIAGWVVFYVLLIGGMLGGLFTMLSLTLCGPLTEAGVGWLYFLLLSGFSILLGAFGSVFNTYAGLYLAKDNDLLLSLPIPVKTIIASRLLNVYLLGAMYSVPVLLPALIVYWSFSGATFAKLVCGLLLLLIVTVIVLLLSCVLGLAVAKISLKLKNKSIVTVLISLLFIAGYYFFYFKAQTFLNVLVQNAADYGERIKGAAAALWAFGRIGEGDLLWTAVFLAAVAALTALVWLLLSKSFLRVAGGSASEKKTRLKDKPDRARSAFGALLGREFKAFTSNPNYMLNCGLGVLLIPALGVALLVKGPFLFETFAQVLQGKTNFLPVLISAALTFLCTMNSTAAPSVSLEGRALWVVQSLPLEAKTVLRAKASMQALLSAVPMLFTSVSAAAVLETDLFTRVLVVLYPVVFSLFFALFCTVVGVKMPLLDWTNPVTPIKQSGAVMVTTFGGWGICAVPAALYLLLGSFVDAAPYLLVFTLLFAAAAVLLLRWLDTKGSRIFSEL